MSKIINLPVDLISLRTHKRGPDGAQGAPYEWKDKKTGTVKPRTMVSIKSGEDWYMGWSYKTGGPAEQIKQGDVIEVYITEDTMTNPDGTTKVFKNWKFPTTEDRAVAELAELKAKLAAMEGDKVAPVAQAVPAAPVQAVAGTQIPTTLGSVSDGSVPTGDIPF